jgi:phosphoglycerate dehydrogenase-like enzyme
VSDPLVWLPFGPELLGDPPAGLRYEVVDPTTGVPDSVTDVRFYVPPYAMSGEVAEVLPRMASLEVVQTLSAGVDNVRDAVPDGVTLCNGRGIHDASTAELALTLILSSLRGVPEFVRDQDRRRWRSRWRPALADRRVLVVGHGSIGAAIERRLVPFEAEVVKVARTARDDVHGWTELPALVPEADVVVLIVPLTDETRGLVDGDFLAAMPDGALLVNAARGPVVDTDALVEALRGGAIAGAALDVTDPEPLPADDPLLDAPNLLIVPHIGSATTGTRARMAAMAVDNLLAALAGRPMPHPAS